MNCFADYHFLKFADFNAEALTTIEHIFEEKNQSNILNCMMMLSMHLITPKSECDSFEFVSVIKNTRIKSEIHLPYRMKIFTDFH